MRIQALASFLLITLYSLAFPHTAIGADGRLQADGPELVLSLNDGRILRGDDLIGVRFVLAGPHGKTQVQIVGFAEDTATTGGSIPLYSLSVSTPDGLSDNFCRPDSRGRHAGFPLPDGAGGFNFTCTSGAEGKCVLMGYRPWEARDGVPMRDLHRACVHMLRADYGGDDQPTTRDGTSVDVFDRFGIQKSEKADGMQFEAAWGPDGAVCVAHPRIAQNVTFEQLTERYPRLAGRLGPKNCSLEMMQAEPRALLFNHSFP
ncbi:ADYC domain-containing protein [Microvirga sp. G4-2]|uniref:ADYC domain-containing protein n=1 Tax=Microvirga sp. G4-2 TaxID=3434467 RepID=UPI004044C162